MQADNPLPASGPVPLARDDLVRRLSTRYLVVLVAVICLVVADEALIQPLLLRMNGYAPAINMAGRQRMLSQKLAKAALALQSAPDEATRVAYRAELRGSLNEWAAAHESLQQRAADRSVAHLSSPAIEDAWAQLKPHFRAMRSAATLLASASTISTDDFSTKLRAIAKHEPLFLITMDHLVSLMEVQSAAEIRRLRFLALAVASTIVALVSAVGWFVIRPAIRAIRGQVTELEDQVALRTRKLDEMLATLRSEIAERQASQARNQALAAQLAHANRVESVGHLAAGLAHELNQPFATIVNYMEACNVALEQPLDEQGQRRLQEFIERVRQSSLRAGGIMRRIRNFVQPGCSATMPTELVALVHEVVELCYPEARRAETILLLHPPDAGEIVVEVDPIQIQQVLVNLIQNALHAVQDMPPPRRQIVLQITAQADAVQIDVADNGRGLGEVDADSLFAPFHTTKTDGLGIGLSICRSIIEQHHGTIWAQSLSPRGAQFSFVLPRLSSHAAEPHRQPDSVCR
jgi:C4-dicarboxylate-specific signal transduction histidine kinase